MNESMATAVISIVAIVGMIVIGCVCMKCMVNVMKHQKKNEHEE
ncbi:hypothetical protein [Clostridium sp. JS66]|nr:hypothetical protein [Clostridium sp. JS66]WPC42366.1 hypothetical protein Q6H37_02570 [Clostridium sp. JS66]